MVDFFAVSILLLNTEQFYKGTACTASILTGDNNDLTAAALSAFFSDSLLPQPVKIIVLIAANKIPAAFLFIFITIASKIFMIYF